MKVRQDRQIGRLKLREESWLLAIPLDDKLTAWSLIKDYLQ